MALRDQIRIMVVDDMSTSRGIITQTLDALGIRHVSTAEDGANALEVLANAPVHLVISDYHMPTWMASNSCTTCAAAQKPRGSGLF